MPKIKQERQKCIGCGSCVALCPKYWQMADDGKSKPVGKKPNSEGNYEFETNELSCNKEAAESCPVSCIYIEL